MMLRLSDLDQDLRTKIKQLVRREPEWAELIQQMLADYTCSPRDIRRVVVKALKEECGED